MNLAAAPVRLKRHNSSFSFSKHWPWLPFAAHGQQTQWLSSRAFHYQHPQQAEADVIASADVTNTHPKFLLFFCPELYCSPSLVDPAVIWDAIKASCESDDLATARLILDTAGVIVARPDMTIMYDERGARYVLPKYVLSAPSNLVEGGGQEVQLQPQTRT